MAIIANYFFLVVGTVWFLAAVLIINYNSTVSALCSQLESLGIDSKVRIRTFVSSEPVLSIEQLNMIHSMKYLLSVIRKPFPEISYYLSTKDEELAQINYLKKKSILLLSGVLTVVIVFIVQAFIFFIFIAYYSSKS